MEKEINVFEVLNKIDCAGKVEQKNGLNYLSWAWAWSIVKKNFPNAQYKIYERDMIIDTLGNVCPCNYFSDGKTAWVKTSVTINGLEHIEMLPVMDLKNKSVPLENIDSMAVNKTIQRSLTKALARHGLGLYIYAGEDLPEEVKEEQNKEREKYYQYCVKHLKEFTEYFKTKGKEFNINLNTAQTGTLKKLYESGVKLFKEVEEQNDKKK